MKQDLKEVKMDSRVKNETAEEFLMRQPESWRQELTEIIYKFLNEGKELDDQEIFRACREANREKQRKAGLISW